LLFIPKVLEVVEQTLEEQFDSHTARITPAKIPLQEVKGLRVHAAEDFPVLLDAGLLAAG